MDWKQRYIVVDLNAMDAASLAPLADRCRDEQLRLMIPDGAFFEMSKGTLPRERWRNALSALAPYREFVSVSHKLTAMMHAEVSSGTPSVDLVNGAGTRFARSMLAQLSQGDETLLAKIMDGPMKTLLPDARKAWANHDENKEAVKGLCDIVRDLLTASRLNALRRAPETELIKWSSSIDAMRFVFQGIRSRTQDDERAYLLASQPSVTGGFYSAFFALASHWLAFCGLETAAPAALTNDLHDLDYIVFGALCREFASDKRAKRIRGAVAAAFEARMKWFASAEVA